MTEGTFEEVFRRLGFMRRTHYGEKFIVEAKQAPNNLAYTSGTLGLHVDLPIYHYTPGV